MKKKIRELNEKPKYIQYLSLALINIVFFGLMYIPAFFELSENVRAIICIVLYIAWMGYSFVYGFCSIEIANSVIIGNVMMAVIATVYCVLGGNDVLKIYLGNSFVGEIFSCFWYSLRYSLCAFVVGFVIKNTR